MRDSIGLTMLKLGKDPPATRSRRRRGIAEIQKAVDAGIVRAFMGNDYAEEMVSGNVVLAMAWSGDIIVKQAEKETLAWHLPDEGGMLWTDNMLIPKAAQHKYTAELFVNFVYDPTIAAQIAAWVNYVTPVKGAKEVSPRTIPEMAENPLILPAPRSWRTSRSSRACPRTRRRDFNDAFSEVTGN